MSSTMTAQRCVYALPILVVAGGAIAGMPAANADNKRLNESVAVNVYTIQHQAGCTTDLKINPQLRLAAQWHTNDVLNNRALDGDIGSDGSTVADRVRNAAGFKGVVAETVAINPGAGDQRRGDHEPVVLPARLHGDHVELRQHRDRGVVGEQAGPQRRRRGLRTAGLAAHRIRSPPALRAGPGGRPAR